MAEMVSSAIVHEAVNRIVSGMLYKYEGKATAEEHMERLEMAQIKLEAALETSDKWHITDASLLRWQKKLKRAAQECDDTLRKCRQRVQEEEEMRQEVSNSSIPRRIAQASKSFISSIFYRNINESGTSSAVRRFERFACGSNEFLRFVEFGGTPRHCMFSSPLIRHLLEEETLEYKSVRGNKHHLFCIRPFNIVERRIEARLIFGYRDGSAPEDDFFLSMMLQLSESTDIVGIVIQCLQMFAPYFKSAAETVRKELTLLPMQDFSWVPYVDSCHKEHWDNIHSISTQWFRPNPLCCKQHGGHKICGGNIDTSGLPGVSLEPVIKVNLQCQVPLPGFSRERTIAGGKISFKDFPHLKADLVFTPHGSSEDLLPAVESSLIEIINCGEQHCLHTNITLEQVEEIMLPKAIDYFCQHTKATVYQMLLKSRHGTVYLQVEKATMKMPSRKGKLLQQQEQELEIPTHVISDLFNLSVAQAPVRLQDSIVDWIQKEKETQLAPPPLRLKF